MEFCKRHRLLHVLPRAERRIAWSWRTENGTIFRIVGRDRPGDCQVEILNVLLPLIAVLLTLIVCLRQKCGKRRKSSRGYLPFHTTRTSLCLSILLILFLEICESILTTISLSSIFTILAVFSCWILHRRTEITGKDSGIIFTAAIFAGIGLARSWKCIYLSRYGLSIAHVRFATAASSAILCGSFAVLDSYTLYLTTRRKRRYLIGQEADERGTVYRHSEATFVGRITFHWVVSLLSKGYEAPLECQDLGQLPEEESAARQFEKFKAVFDGERGKKQLSLWRCFWKRVWFPFAVGGFLKLLGDAAALVGPMTISKILDYVAVTQNGTNHRTYRVSAMTFAEVLDNGYFLALLAFVFALLQSTLSQASTHVLCVEGIRLKTALQALLYDKALRLYSLSIDEDLEKDREQQKSQQTADMGTLTNLVSEDAYNVMSFFWIGHYTWAIPLKVNPSPRFSQSLQTNLTRLQIAVIVSLLYAKLGISAIIGALCCILLVTPMQLILGKKMSGNFKSVTSRSDARLGLVNEILQGMKLVKLRAWEDIFERKIAATRDEELKLLDKDSVYWALINFLSHASSVLMTLFTFGAYYWLEDRSLEAGSVFAGLALFSQLTVPLLIFPVTIPIIINAMVSTTRMEDFLQLPDMENVLPNLGDRRSEAIDDISSGTDSVEESTVAATKLSSDATYGSLGNIEEDEEDGESGGSKDCRCRVTIDSSVDTVFEKDAETPVLRIKECAFSVRCSEEGQLPMLIQELDFPRGQLTLIVGKTGSGKTSLLLGMLGEIQRTSGSIEWSKSSKIAYVAQKPWLLNATLRDNILFGSAYKPKRYRSVLKACALQPDIEVLPGQDLTRIGENGINLSGGQKQRVAIARAIYSDADIAIMDDPLSALDPQVGQQIFDQGIRKLLLRTGRTVIMVTHRLDLLSTAHQVIVMDDCRVRATGTKSAIEESDPKLATEWRKAVTRQQDGQNSHRIARDWWSLLRLVSRIGINAKHKKDARVNPPAFVPLRMRRTTLSGSSYLTPDLTDLPVPTDEWNIAEKPSKFHPNATRSISLQPQRRPPPVLRQSSTPTMLESGHVATRKRNNTFDNGQTSGVFRQIFSGRSNQVCEQDHLPVKRLLSVESKGAESNDTEERSYDAEDYESYEDRCGMVTRTICIDYSKAGGWIPGLIYMGLAILCQILRVYTDLWLSCWTDRERDTLVEGEENTWFYFRVYLSLSMGSILLSFACNAVGQWTGARARRQLHEEAISKLLRVPLSFFEYNPVGKILSRFSADMGVIDKKLSTSIQRLTFFVLLCGSAITVNVIVSPWFLVAALPTCAIYYLVQRFYRRSARHLQRLDGSTRWPIATHFSETLAGLATLRASKQENRFMDQATKCLDINTNAFLLLNASSRWLGIALDYLGAVIVVAATFAALISAELYPSRVTPALVGLAINYTLLVPIYLNWVVKFTAEIEMYMGSVARISAYRHADSEDYQDEDGHRVPELWPSKGEIIFDDVSLIYHTQKEPAISNLSLKIPAGQKIGVCGRTGSGKSSTMMALFRLVEIVQGRILIDGVDVRRLPLKTLRSRLSAIPQDVIMFGGTIRENLDPLGEHDDRELWNALEIAQIKDVVASHPEGLDFEVREGGENFSSGQLQLLSMARAILRMSSIVVLDEATSGLDVATEKSLLKTVSATFENRTVIVIAHRAAALLDCDRIIVFHEGKIVEDGSPMDLSGRPGGFFANMVKSSDGKEDTVR
ncbi:sulfonylurea receptor isoform X2 [Augochlora pura]